VSDLTAEDSGVLSSDEFARVLDGLSGQAFTDCCRRLLEGAEAQRAQEILDVAEQSLTAPTRPRDFEWVSTATKLVEFLSKRGDGKRSIRFQQTVIEVADRLGDVALACAARGLLVDCCASDLRWRDAARMMRQCLDHCVAEGPQGAKCSLRLARALTETGRHQEALELATAVRESLVGADDKNALFDSERTIVRCLRGLERHDEALEAIDRWEAHDPRWYLFMKADVLCGMHRYSEALELYELVSARWEDTTTRLHLDRRLLTVLTALGRNEEARVLLDDLLVRAEGWGAADRDMLATVVYGNGYLHRRDGREEDALRAFEEAVGLYQGTGEVGETSSLSAVVCTLLNLERYGEAELALRKLERALADVPEVDERRAFFLFLQGDLLRLRGDFGTALDTLTSARSIYDDCGVDAHRRLEVCLAIARCCSQMGDLDTALEVALDACTQFEDLIDGAGGTDGDIDAYRRSLRDPFPLTISLLLSRANAARGSRQAELIAQAYGVIERARGRKFRSEMMRSFQSGISPLPSAPAQTLDQSCAVAQQADPHSPTELKSMFSGWLPPLDTMFQALEPEEMLVSYYRSHDRILVFWVDRHGAIEYRVIEDADRLDHHIDQFRTELECATSHPAWEFEQPLEGIGEVLLRPLVEADVIGTSSRLTIVPSEGMELIPWAALIVPGTGTALIESVVVSVVPQVSVRYFQRSKRATGDAKIAVIDPDGTLMSSVREQAALADAMDTVYFRAESGAVDVDNFVRILGEARMLHLSCHGVFEPEAPLDSGLTVGPPAAPQRITAKELLALDARLDLIVANACESSRVRIASGEDHLGIQRALLYLSKHVVGTLWPVEDDTAAQFAKALHRELAKGSDPITATALAQRFLKTWPDYAHPYRWAAFQASG